jgi:hypothetical protein
MAMSRCSCVMKMDGLVVVGKSGIIRKPRRAIGMVMTPSTMNSPEESNCWSYIEAERHLSSHFHPAMPPLPSRRLRPFRIDHVNTNDVIESLINPLHTACKSPLTMGPIALAICEGNKWLSHCAEKVTYRLTWNKQPLFASSSFLYQLPITYYAGGLTSLSPHQEMTFPDLGSPECQDRRLTLPTQLGNGLHRGSKSFCSTRGT